MNYKTVSIVIPVYNEETYILTVLDKVIASPCDNLFKDIIIVDDCSKDNTVKNVTKYISILKDKNVSIRLHKKTVNEGKGAALVTGFGMTKGEVVIVQDADLEYDPSDYANLLEPFFKHDADAVYGSRFITNRPRRVLYFWHYLANLFLTNLSNIFTNLNLSDMETGYKVFRGDLIRELAPQLKSKQFGFEPEITARLSKRKNIRFYEVGISYWGRTYDEGKKIGWKDGFRAIWEIIKFNVIDRE